MNSFYGKKKKFTQFEILTYWLYFGHDILSPTWRFQNVHTTFKKNEFDIGAYVNVVNAGGFLYSLICILFYVKKTRTWLSK